MRQPIVCLERKQTTISLDVLKRSVHTLRCLKLTKYLEYFVTLTYLFVVAYISLKAISQHLYIEIIDRKQNTLDKFTIVAISA